MKKLIKSLLVLFVFLSLLPAPDPNWVYPGDPTTGVIQWSPGDTVQINSAVTFTGATIIAWGDALQGVNITLAQPGQIVIDGTSSLTFRGNNYNSNQVALRKTAAAPNHQSILAQAGSVIRISNTLIEDAYRGIQLFTDNAIIDRTEFRNSQLVGIYLDNCSPRITRCWVSLNGGQYSLAAVNLSNPPQFFGNYFNQGSSSHITMTTAVPNANLFFEGNYFGGAAPVIRVNAANFTASNRDNVYPVLASNPWGGTMYLAGVGAGTDGTINNPNFYMFGDDFWGVNNGSVTIANGATVTMGVSRNVLGAPTIYGNTSLLFNGLYSLNVSSGGSLQSRGTVALPNTIRSAAGGTSRGIWNEILLSNGSTGRFDNTTIQNGTSGLNVVANPTSLQLNTVSINYNTNGINTNSSSTFQNLYMAGNTSAFRVTGGTPIIRNNRIVGDASANTAFTITGGTFPVGNIRGNTLNNTIDTYMNSSGAAGIVYAEQNYWSVHPPVTTNFTGSDVIDYSPWRDAAAVNRNLFPTPNLMLPVNGANLAAAPSLLTFNVAEIGMHNDSPISYELQLDTQPNFATATTFTGINQQQNTTLQSNVSAYPFAIGTTYYWRVRALTSSNPLGYSVFCPSWNFTIQQPILSLVLSTNPAKTYASAGEMVRYRINFTYSSATPPSIANSRIVSCLPDDVYFNGNLTLQGMVQPTYGTITVRAYQDIAATVLLGQVSGAYSGINSFTNATPGWVAAANNHLVRRIDVIITALNTGNTGDIYYETIVK